MKLSMAVAVPELATAKVGLTGANLPGILRQLKTAGYDAVEIMPAQPSQIHDVKLARLLQQNEMAVAAIGSGLMAAATGYTLLSLDKTVQRAAFAVFCQLIDLASEYGVLVTIGGFRGWLKQGGKPGESGYSRAVDILGECARYAAVCGVRIAFEPLNRYETDFIRNIAEGLTLLGDIGAPHFGLVVDTFHMNIEEASLPESIKQAGDRIFHVHIGDSNRYPPGCGHIDFRAVTAALADIGYNEYLSAELIPWPDAVTALNQTAAEFHKWRKEMER